MIILLRKSLPGLERRLTCPWLIKINSTLLGVSARRNTKGEGGGEGGGEGAGGGGGEGEGEGEGLLS